MWYTVERNWYICALYVGQTVGDGLVSLYSIFRVNCRKWIDISEIYPLLPSQLNCTYILACVLLSWRSLWNTRGILKRT